MKEQTKEQQLKREQLKKLLLALPILVLPFLFMTFAVLGGGKGDNTAQASSKKGINTQLPGAQFKNNKPEDKLSLYDQMGRDSAQSRSNAANPLFPLGKQNSNNSVNSSYNQSADESTAKINQKLAQINRDINRPDPIATSEFKPGAPQKNTETERLQNLLKTMNNKSSEDPEMKQLNGMLDKIMAIQNPGLLKVKQDGLVLKDTAFKAIPAVIEGNQKVLQGGVVKLRLMDSVILKNATIPKGTLLFGSCNITNQRLLLDIKNIRLGTAIIPVDLSVFSLDGMPGINAPEAELGQAAGTGTDNALQNMQLLPMDQSLSIQAASAGINAAKGLIGKKLKRIKVKLKTGYHILLRNNQPDKRT
jgi:hypothetical protein